MISDLYMDDKLDEQSILHSRRSSDRHRGISIERRSSFQWNGHTKDDFFYDVFQPGIHDSNNSSHGSHAASFGHGGRPSSWARCSGKITDQPGIPASCYFSGDIPLAKKSRNSTDCQGHEAANIRGHFKKDSTNLVSDKRFGRSSYFSILKPGCGGGILPVSQGRKRSADKFNGSEAQALREAEMCFENRDITFIDKPNDLQNKDGSFSSEVFTEKEPREYTLPHNFQPTILTSGASKGSDARQGVRKHGLFDTSDSSRSDSNVEIKAQKGGSAGVPSDAKDIAISLEDKVNPSRFREKVKGFFKKIHKDFSCKQVKCIEPQSQTFKVKGGRNKFEWAQVGEVDADIQDRIDLGRTQSNAAKWMEEIPSRLEQESLPFILHDVRSAPQEDGSEIENIDYILENIEEICADSEEPQSQIEGMDADLTVKEWYYGKEGNIRSLLSTLHYVLWPGSGWKPIHLADLVECASVKKAYLKAILTLHPDKLQQRGVITNYKYIAGEVFAILQEAWSEFSKIAPL